MDILEILEYSSVTVFYLTGLFGLFLYQRQTNALKILSAFLLFGIIIQSIIIYLTLNEINNLFLFHLYTPIEFGVFCLVFAQNSKSVLTKNITLIISILFVTFCVTSTIFIEGIEMFNSITRGVEGVLAIGFSVFFFYHIFVSEDQIDLMKSPHFWLFSGWLIYFSGTFFLFIYANHAGTNITYPIIHSVLNIFLNLVYTKALWLGSKKSIM